MTLLNAQGSRLAVVRPDSTSAVTAFTASLPTEVTRVFVCNTSGGARTFRMLHGESGDSFDEENALFWDVAVAANTTYEVFSDAPNAGVSMRESDIIGVRSDAADGLTFSIYGVTTSIAPGRY
ncbi:MAG: hypothetical protein P8Y36_00420 [Alphaproteobacteria bacterium]